MLSSLPPADEPLVVAHTASGRPTTNLNPARWTGIHIPQTRVQINAKAEAHRTKDNDEQVAKAELVNAQREELQALMAAQTSSTASGVDPMSIFEGDGLDDISDTEDDQVEAPSAARTPMDVNDPKIIDVGSSDAEDVPSCQSSPSPPSGTVSRSQSVDLNDHPIAAEKNLVKPTPRVNANTSKGAAKV
jgi:hypothetical protein